MLLQEFFEQIQLVGTAESELVIVHPVTVTVSPGDLSGLFPKEEMNSSYKICEDRIWTKAKLSRVEKCSGRFVFILKSKLSTAATSKRPASRILAGLK